VSEVVAAPARSRSAWKWVTLADVGKVITGNTPPTADAENYGDAIPFVKPTELVDRGIRSAPSGLAPQAMGKARVVPAGAVLVSCIGNLGKTGIAKVPVAFNQQINAVVFNENVVPEFGFYYAQTLKPWLYGESSATTIPIVNKGKFQQARFPLAPVDEQREIVAELEKQFSRLDEAVANLQRVKANLKRYKASVLKAAVEGHLVETEASLAHREGRTYETGEQLLQRILDERRAKWNGKGKYKEPLPLDTNGIGTTPEGWGWAAVEVICESIVDCPHSTAKFQPNGYPCVDTTWMTTEGLVVDRARFVDEATYLDRISRLAPKPGDIVFAREGTIGTAVLIPDRMTPCLGQRVMLLRASQEYLNGLLVHVLHSEVVKSQYRAQALGSTVAHINVGDVKRFAVPVPPLAEQVRILAEVDRHLSIIREVEAEVDANLQRAQALRQSVLARAFLEGVK
jgi:type I restriction enzyme S subunit